MAGPILNFAAAFRDIRALIDDYKAGNWFGETDGGMTGVLADVQRLLDRFMSAAIPVAKFSALPNLPAVAEDVGPAGDFDADFEKTCNDALARLREKKLPVHAPASPGTPGAAFMFNPMVWLGWFQAAESVIETILDWWKSRPSS